MDKVDSLAKRLFDAYAINSGYNPAEHFNRDAGNQWMRMALMECGVEGLIRESDLLLKGVDSVNGLTVVQPQDLANFKLALASLAGAP